MADQKNIAPPAKPAVAQPKRRNPGWCLAADLPAGKTSQDMTQRERQVSALQHEAKWKKRYGQQGVVEDPWSRGNG